MNEALQDAYNLFIKGGYNGTIEDFSTLISTNPEALNDSFELFAEGGYNGTSDDYIELIGLKKKDNPDILKPSLSGNTMGLDSGAGGLEPSMLDEEFRAEQDSINLTSNILLDKQQQLQNLDSQIQSREPNVVGEDIPITPTEFEDLNMLRGEIDSLETDLFSRQEKLDKLRFEIPDDVEVEINQEEQESFDPYEKYDVQNPRKSFMGRFKDFVPDTLEKVQTYLQSDAILGEEAVKKFNA